MHRNYLKARGFCPKELEQRWEIRGVGRQGGAWAFRVLIPLHNLQGQWISYTARCISDKAAPRYLNLEHNKSLAAPGDILYGEHLVVGNVVIVVEGPFDAWRMGRGAVATLGAGWSPAQALRLLNYQKCFIFFDSDPTGVQKARKLANWLAPHSIEVEILTDIASDPASLSSEEVKCLRRELEIS